jgi:hypothetical protein
MRVIEKADIAPIEPLLCSIQAGTAIIGRSERFIVDAIARGQLQAVKSNRRTLLVVQSLKDYVAALPRAKGTINSPRRVPAGARQRGLREMPGRPALAFTPALAATAPSPSTRKSSSGNW